MKEYRWSVDLRHKATGDQLHIYVWAPTNEEATHKLTDALLGPEGEYTWIGTGPDYDNGPRERDFNPANP